MKETGSPKLLFEMLDLTPIQPILWMDLHREGPGRPVKYNSEIDLRALMLRQLEQFPYVKDLVKRLRRNLYLRLICGNGEDVPARSILLALSNSNRSPLCFIYKLSDTLWDGTKHEKFKSLNF